MDCLQNAFRLTGIPRTVSTLPRSISTRPSLQKSSSAKGASLSASGNWTRKDGAPGVDGQVAAGYEADLEANLSSLLDRFKSGLYRAPPVKRVYIPKGDGKRLRPIGIPTLEDKVLQRAVVMILEPLYEQQFLDESYGFRPGRSAHQALNALWQRIMPLSQCWLIELDIIGTTKRLRLLRPHPCALNRSTYHRVRALFASLGTARHTDDLGYLIKRRPHRCLRNGKSETSQVPVAPTRRSMPCS